MTEVAKTSCTCAVYHYDTQNKNWTPADSGRSRMHLYHSPGGGTFRIIAMDVQKNEVTINTNIFPLFAYQKVTDVFHQFADKKQVYGLNFVSLAEADDFAQNVEKAREQMNGGETEQPMLSPTFLAASTKLVGISAFFDKGKPDGAPKSPLSARESIALKSPSKDKRNNRLDQGRRRSSSLVDREEKKEKKKKSKDKDKTKDKLKKSSKKKESVSNISPKKESGSSPQKSPKRASQSQRIKRPSQRSSLASPIRAFTYEEEDTNTKKITKQEIREIVREEIRHELSLFKADLLLSISDLLAAQSKKEK